MLFHIKYLSVFIPGLIKSSENFSWGKEGGYKKKMNSIPLSHQMHYKLVVLFVGNFSIYTLKWTIWIARIQKIANYFESGFASTYAAMLATYALRKGKVMAR